MATISLFLRSKLAQTSQTQILSLSLLLSLFLRRRLAQTFETQKHVQSFVTLSLFSVKQICNTEKLFQ